MTSKILNYRDNMNYIEVDGFGVQLVSDGVYAIDEFGIAIMYLIEGKEKALLLDTGIGLGQISETIKKITNLPIIVVNSHHHYDHVGGNGQFLLPGIQPIVFAC